MSRSKHQQLPGLVAVDDVTASPDYVGQQLGQLLERMTTVQSDVAVLRDRSDQVPLIAARVSALERAQARWWSLWAVAVVFGAAIGWLAAYMTRSH